MIPEYVYEFQIDRTLALVTFPAKQEVTFDIKEGPLTKDN